MATVRLNREVTDFQFKNQEKVKILTTWNMQMIKSKTQSSRIKVSVARLIANFDLFNSRMKKSALQFWKS